MLQDKETEAQRANIIKAVYHVYHVPGTMLNSLLPTSFFLNVVGILHLI